MTFYFQSHHSYDKLIHKINLLNLIFHLFVFLVSLFVQIFVSTVLFCAYLYGSLCLSFRGICLSVRYTCLSVEPLLPSDR